jgi:hypothetical protein
MTQLKHLSKTYRQLRLIAGWTLIVAPLLIIAVACITEHTSEVKAALSDYYFVEQYPGIVRTLFTGFLVLVGGILIAYRGFDDCDNWIHNAAGALAICVAIFPERCDSEEGLHCAPGLHSSLHLPSAILVLLFAAWAVYYCGGHKLKDRLKYEEFRTLRRARVASLFLMTIAVVLYAVKHLLSKLVQGVKAPILGVELAGFFGFALHWLVMTRVIARANHRIREQRKFSESGGRALAKDSESKAAPLTQPGVAGAAEQELFEIP